EPRTTGRRARRPARLHVPHIRPRRYCRISARSASGWRTTATRERGVMVILRETNDSGDEVSIVIERVVAWKRAHNRITVYVGYHTFAFFGEVANRIESRLWASLGVAAGERGAADAAAPAAGAPEPEPRQAAPSLGLVPRPSP